MAKRFKLDYESPIGVIEIIGTKDAIISILFSEENIKKNLIQLDTPKVLKECYKELDEYFKGTRYDFTIPYEFQGTDFQKAVWNDLKNISYAETRFI